VISKAYPDVEPEARRRKNIGIIGGKNASDDESLPSDHRKWEWKFFQGGGLGPLPHPLGLKYAVRGKYFRNIYLFELFDKKLEMIHYLIYI
jgi:hypothetical protein